MNRAEKPRPMSLRGKHTRIEQMSPKKSVRGSLGRAVRHSAHKGSWSESEYRAGGANYPLPSACSPTPHSQVSVPSTYSPQSDWVQGYQAQERVGAGQRLKTKNLI